MAYDISKLAAHILRHNKDDMALMSTATKPVTGMVELVEVLQSESVCKTAIVLCGLSENDFLTNDSPPIEVRGLKKATEKEVKIPLPNIFSSDVKKTKPEFLDVTTLAELLFKQLNPINFPDGVLDKITLNEGFLHNSHSSNSELGVRYENELIRQFFVTQADVPKSNVSYFQKYDEDLAEKAWAKLVLLFDHISALIALSEYTNQVIKLLIKYCDTDLDTNKMNQFISAIREAVKQDVSGYEPEEEAWLVTNFLSQYIYKFALNKHRTAQNLNETYGKVPFIGGGDSNVPTLKPTEEVVKSLLSNSNTPSAPKSNPKPQTPVFTPPEGTDEVSRILGKALPKNESELTELRALAHKMNTAFNKSDPDDRTPKMIRQSKLIENWLSAK